MKAAIINKFGKPNVFEIAELSVPQVNDDQILVKIYASSINPMDYKSRQGNHKYILGSKFPVILGYDMAGIVIKTGENTKRFKVGDKVHGRSDVKYGGTLAQFGVTSEHTLSHIPEILSFNEAAGIPLAALTALQALRDKGKIKTGDNVLITGATGGVGHFAVQLVKYFDAKCFAVASSKHHEFITELAPDVFIDYTTNDFKNLNEKFDIIFDAAGKESYLSCKHLLKRKGVYITSLPRPKLLIHKVISLFNAGYVKTLLMKSNHKDLDFVNSLVSKGIIKIKIDKVFRIVFILILEIRTLKLVKSNMIFWIIS